MRSTFLAVLALSGLLATIEPVWAQTKESKIGGKTADEWLKDLPNGDPSVRQTALGALAQFGSVIQKKASEPLVKALGDRDGSVRVNAAIAVGTIGIDPSFLKNGLEALLLQLNSPQGIVRLHATLTLGRLGPVAKPAVHRLTSVTIKDQYSWEIRKAAATALCSIALDRENGPDAYTVNALLQAIHGPYADPCALVRLEAIISLSVLGISARPGELEQLVKTLEGAKADRDKSVQIWARVLILGFDRNAAVEPHIKVIGKYLKDPDMQVRTQAARSVAPLGPRAKSLIPDLLDNLKDNEADAASAAAQSLVALKDNLTDKNLDIIGEMFKSKEATHRARAAHMVALLGKKADRCIDQLIAALKDNDMNVVGLCVYALGEIGPPARKALPALTALTSHKDLSIQNTTREAISKIEAKPK